MRACNQLIIHGINSRTGHAIEIKTAYYKKERKFNSDTTIHFKECRREVERGWSKKREREKCAHELVQALN